MAKKTSSIKTTSIEDLVARLEPALAAMVNQLRHIVLSAHAALEEQVKWNAVSFLYTGPLVREDPKNYIRDLAVLNTQRGYILMIFPGGRELPDPDKFFDETKTDGRGIKAFHTLEEIRKEKESLKKLILEWITLRKK